MYKLYFRSWETGLNLVGQVKICDLSLIYMTMLFFVYHLVVLYLSPQQIQW